MKKLASLISVAAMVVSAAATADCPPSEGGTSWGATNPGGDGISTTQFNDTYICGGQTFSGDGCNFGLEGSWFYFGDMTMRWIADGNYDSPMPTLTALLCGNSRKFSCNSCGNHGVASGTWYKWVTKLYYPSGPNLGPNIGFANGTLRWTHSIEVDVP